MNEDDSAGRPVVGVDLGGTNMQFGVVDATNHIIGRSRAKTEADRGVSHVIDRLHVGVREACGDAGVSLEEVAAVGIAAAGAMDIDRGVVLSSPNLGWSELPLRDMVQVVLGKPVVLDNDVNGATWGEVIAGAGRGAGDVLGVWIGTGVGGGLVLGGRLHRGSRHTAGEIGHVVLHHDGEPGHRVVEDFCSRTGIIRQLRERAVDSPTGTRPSSGIGPAPWSTVELADAYRSDHALVREIVDEGAASLGLAIANVVTLLSIDTVILGGGVTEQFGQPLVDRIQGSFARYVFPPQHADCAFRITELRANAGLIGAALLARG